MKLRKAVIPVGGLGTHIYQQTRAVPKEMFPILNKPVIQYVVGEALQAGLEEIYIVTKKRKSY